MLLSMNPLPIDEILPEFLQGVRTHSNIILHAPPGAGKSTRVPLSLLQIIPPSAGKIIMLEPRRLAAVSVAGWMSATLGEEVGNTVGYRIRFENRISSSTRIEVVTEGILTRMIQNNPLLEGVGLIIFDEFHERTLHGDLGLALSIEIQRQVREDLKIIVMSATLDLEPLIRLLNNPPLFSSTGRAYPVQILYRENPALHDLSSKVLDAAEHALNEYDGDILVFLPGVSEIKSAERRLSSHLGDAVSICPLYGELPFLEQQRAILKGEGRKIILATSIAETSLTVEGVSIVIDSGLARRIKYDQGRGVNRLVTARASKSASIQRAGRAGRTAKGVCYRLYSEHSYNAMIPHTPPEILESDLSPLLLELALWGVSEPKELQWIDPPPEPSVLVGRELLIKLGALESKSNSNDSYQITKRGREMAQMPLHPRLAAVLLRGMELGIPSLACDVAALLSERDILRTAGRFGGNVSGSSDISLSSRIEILRKWRSDSIISDNMQSGVLKAVCRVGEQLRRLTKSAGKECDKNFDKKEPLQRIILAGFSDRLAERRVGSCERYLLANGAGVRLAGLDRLSENRFLLALSTVQSNDGEATIHLAEPVDLEIVRDELQKDIETRNSCSWNPREGRICAVSEEVLGALTLSCRQANPDLEDLKLALLDAIRDSELSLLSRSASFYQLQGRINLLRRIFTDDGWFDASDKGLCDSVEKWLGGHLQGVRTKDQLLRLNCTELLKNMLEYRQRKLLEQLAPEFLKVPSGSEIKIDYTQGENPVLAVKLQELFGLAETPTVAAGRVLLTIHLLSPAGRALQVTQDLKSFWDGSYQDVKKEMKGRYPKHPWPDNPWNATPTRRVKAKL